MEHGATKCYFRYSQSKNSTTNAHNAYSRFKGLESHLSQVTTDKALSFENQPHTCLTIASLNEWFMDRGVIHHFTSNINQLQEVVPYTGSSYVMFGNDVIILITHSGIDVLSSASCNMSLVWRKKINF